MNMQNMYVPLKLGSIKLLPYVMVKEQRISLVLMVQDMIRCHNSGLIGPHQVTSEREETLVHAEYVCAAQVWLYHIVTKCNCP